MKRFVSIFSVAVLGCGPQLTMTGHVRRIGQAAAVADVAGEKAVERIVRAQELQHEACRDRLDSEYSACMGPLGKPVAPMFEEFGTDFDELADTLGQLEDKAVKIDQLLDEADRVIEAHEGGR